MLDKAKLLKQVDIAFSPAKEIEIPELFSGREDEIVQGIYALRSDGASLCIYGKRGVGKTSFAKQLRLIAAGYSKLIDLISKPELFDDDLFNMPTVYFACDDTIGDINDLFRKLLSDRDALNGICKYNDGIILEKTRKKSSISAKITLRILESEASSTTETENIFAEIDPVSAFKSVTSEIVDSANTSSMVVVIDEFERVAKKIGLSSIIRTCPYVKFIIVGISDDVDSLIQDHNSVKRQLIEGTIEIKPMTNQMLTGIIKRAEAILEEIKFDDEVIARIIAISDGYPYWVHLLGRHSCIDAIEKEQNIIKEENYTQAVEKITKHEPRYERLYRDIASSSIQDEKILKLLALYDTEHISSDEIRKESNKNNILSKTFEYYIKKLVTRKIISRFQSILSFTDPFFKVFVRIRPPIFSEAKLIMRLESFFEKTADSIQRLPVIEVDSFINDRNLSNSIEFLTSIGSASIMHDIACKENFIFKEINIEENKKRKRKYDECPCGSGKKINKCCGIYKK